MRILVTGAAGFIGSALCQSLHSSGHKVSAIDNFSNYYAISLKTARIKEFLEPNNLKVNDLDISNKNELDKYIISLKPDVIINLAAQAGVRLEIDKTYKYIDSNLVGFSNILISAVENKVPLFLYASSSSVYGDSAAIPYIETEKNLYPTSFYGATKLANELLAPTLIKNSSTVARGLRFFTVYGPWGRPDMAYFRMIANIISGSDFNFFGDGSIERDFTFIDDSVSSIVALMNELYTCKAGFVDVVNVGGGRPLSMNYLLETINSLTGKNVLFNRLAANSNDVRKTMSDINLLKSLIGIEPKIQVEEGIAKTIKWAQKDDIRINLDTWVNSVK